MLHRIIVVVLGLSLLVPAVAHAGYSLDRTSTTSGGGTWGSILRMTGSINGSNVTFSITKQSGTFSSSGTMYLKVGTYQPWGADRDSRWINAGSSGTSFTHDLSDYSGYPKYFYGRYETSGGYAWVGPIKVSYTDAPPSFSWSSPSSGSTQTGSFTVSGTAYDNDDIAQVTIALVDSQGTSRNISAYTDPTPSSSSRSIYKTINPESYGLAPGSMSVGIWIVDGDGNNGPGNCVCAVASRSITWRKPDSSPSFSWSSPSSGSTQTGSFTVSGTAYDNDDIAQVTIALVDSQGTSRNISAYTDPTPSSSSRSIHKTINPETYGLAPGSMSVGIWIVDGDGNNGPGNCVCAVASRSITWRKPDSSPSFSWSSPSSGSTQTGSFTVSGTAYDNDDIAQVTIALVDSQGTSRNISAYTDPTPSSSSRSISKTINPESYGLAPGPMSVGIWIVDGDGNNGPGNCVCAVADRNITWQNMNSAGSISSPSGTVEGLIDVIASAEDPDGLQKVSVVFVAHGEPLVLCWDGTSNPCSGTQGNFSVPVVDPRDYGVGGSGSITLGLWILDDQGNVTNPVAHPFNWQAPDASGQITAPSGTVGGLVTVSAQVSDPDGLQKVSVAFVPGGDPLVLCWDQGTNPCIGGSWTLGAVDPADHGALGSGPLTLGLWVLDDNGSLAVVDAHEFTWEKPQGTNQITSPNGSVEGLITVTATATDFDGLEKVSVVLAPGQEPVVLCWDADASVGSCSGSSGTWSKSGVDPRNHGISSSGPVTMGLWVLDDGGRVSNVAVRSFHWQFPDEPGPDATGQITQPSGSVEGDVEVVAQAADPDGLQKVSVVFVPQGEPLVLCEDGTVEPCPGNSGSWTASDIDPADHGVGSEGMLTLGLWVRDDNGVTALVDERAFEWSPGPSYVNVSEWAQEAAHYLVQNDILQDPPNHDLRGIFDANRAEIATMLYRALAGGRSVADDQFASWYGTSLSALFSDVVDGSVWYFKPASYLGRLAYEEEITVFNQEPCIFRPDQPLSRAWILKALLETWDIPPLTDFVGVELFSDVPTSHPAAGYIYAARELGLIGGTDNAYEPNEAADREHLFVMLHRILEVSANPQGISIDQPIPSSEDFRSAGQCSKIGRRFEQPIFGGVSPPTVEISAGEVIRETLGTLEDVHTAILQAQISDLDPGTYLDADGVAHQASAFCAWSTDLGSFIDLDPGGAEPSCRVKWVAPIDVSQASGASASYTVTLYVGDGLGSEVRAETTLSLRHQSGDSTRPTLSIDDLPSGLIPGERVELGGSVQDGGEASDPDYGILEVALRYSLDAGSTWVDLGSADLLEGGRWSFGWFLPQIGSGSLWVEAKAVNLRANPSQAVIATASVGTLLSIDGMVLDSSGQGVENALVTLSGGGLQLDVVADNLGSFRLTSSDSPLVAGVAYSLSAEFDGRSDSTEVTLSVGTPAVYPVLVLDTAPPISAASLPGGDYVSPRLVELSCNDDRSGCAATYFTVDGSTPTLDSAVYSGPIEVQNTSLRFFSVDQMGNTEDIRREDYQLIACDFSLDPNFLQVDAAGGTSDVSVSTLDECAWEALEDSEWLHIDSGSPGIGSGQVVIQILANGAALERSASISVGDQQVTVTQAGIPCRYALSRASALVATVGGSAQVDVMAPQGCPWNAISGGPGLSVVSGASGDGNGVIELDMTSNLGGLRRVVPLFVGGQTFMVYQGGDQIAAGDLFSLWLGGDGSALASGENARGQLGDGSAAARPFPLPVLKAGGGELGGLVALAAGGDHVVALDQQGTIWTWGRGDRGQLGSGNLADGRLADRVLSASGPLTGAVAVAAGESHSLALLGDGSVWAWGGNSSGELGDGSLIDRDMAVRVQLEDGTAISDAVAIVAGDHHNLALRSDGTLVGWGANGDGQTGDGTSISPHTRAVPSPLAMDDSNGGFLPLEGGGGFNLMRSETGLLTSWGLNGRGQLGDGTQLPSLSPKHVVDTASTPLIDSLQPAAGREYALGLMSDGSVFAWGSNSHGQLGDGTLDDRPRASLVLGSDLSPLSEIVMVAAGAFHGLALKADGTLLAWGRNDRGQLGDGSELQRLHPVIAAADGAQLLLSLSEVVDPVDAGAALEYGVHIVNLGRDEAGATEVQVTLSDGILTQVSGSGWSCQLTAAAAAQCTRASLPLGMAEEIQVQAVAPSVAGTVTMTATVVGAAPDPYLDNNSAIEQTTIHLASTATGSILRPGENETLVGDFTVEVDATSTDGLQRVHMDFNAGPELDLCADGTAIPCPGAMESWTLPVDPTAVGLVVGGDVFTRLWVEDDLGQVTQVSDRTFAWLPRLACLETFEHGAGNWRSVAGPEDGGTAPWYRSNASSFAGSFSLAVDGSTIAKDQAAELAVALDLPAVSGIWLRFQHQLTESLGLSGGVLEYSLDSGAGWVDILGGQDDIPPNPERFLAGPYSGSVTCCGTPLEGRAIWTHTASWQPVAVDLSDFAGRTLLLRWRYVASGAGPGDGWLIDDVEITELPVCLLEPLFASGFETGDVSEWE